MNQQRLLDHLKTERGPLYAGVVSRAAWQALETELLRYDYLAVAITDRHGQRVEVFVLSACRPRGSRLEQVGADRAVNRAGLWLNCRHAWEVEASGRWARLLDLPDRRPPAAALPRCA